jgi:mannose-6-phosphate isomerase-like protein (cupin superfamily)
MSGGKTRVLRSGEGDAGSLTSIGVRFLVSDEGSGGGFALVEHPMPPRALGAPLHRHNREDEYSLIVEGRVAALLGEDLVFGDVGDLIFKPRGEWHTFWNPTDQPARILEIISPGAFEGYFRQMIALPPDATHADRAEIAARYDLEVDPESIGRLVAEYGLRLGT